MPTVVSEWLFDSDENDTDSFKVVAPLRSSNMDVDYLLGVLRSVISDKLIQAFDARIIKASSAGDELVTYMVEMLYCNHDFPNGIDLDEIQAEFIDTVIAGKWSVNNV